MMCKILFIAELVLAAFNVVIALIWNRWVESILWLGIGLYSVLWYRQRRKIEFHEKNTAEVIDLADRAIKDNEKILKEYRKLLTALKEAGEVMDALSKDSNVTRYIKARSRMCAGCVNCAKCPLKEAGQKLKNVDLDGCQQMKYCEVFAYLYPADACRMVLEWEEQHGKQN